MMARLLPTFAGLVLCAAPVAAQEVAAHAVRATLRKEDFGRQFGAAVIYAFPFNTSALRWRLGVEFTAGERRWVGSPCTGLIPPDARVCAPRPLRTSSDLLVVRSGLRVPVIHRARVSLSVIGDLGIAGISTVTRDSTNVDRRSARRIMYQPEAGIEGSWQPSQRAPLSITGGATIAELRPFVRDYIVDGYSPFSEPIGSRRIWVGVVVRLPQGRRA